MNGIWLFPAVQMPPLHKQVLIELREGAGTVFDVACYVGKHQIEGAGTEDRWICSDVRLDTRQIRRWSFICSHNRPDRAALRNAVVYAPNGYHKPVAFLDSDQVDAVTDAVMALLSQAMEGDA